MKNVQKNYGLDGSQQSKSYKNRNFDKTYVNCLQKKKTAKVVHYRWHLEEEASSLDRNASLGNLSTPLETCEIEPHQIFCADENHWPRWRKIVPRDFKEELLEALGVN